MVLVLPLLLGLCLAVALGGRVQRIADLRLRGLPLFYCALALQLAAFPTSRMPWRTPDRIATALWLLSYVAVAAAALSNLRVPGVPIVLAGMVSNVAAIVANGGHMPALPSALRAAGLHFSQSRNSVALVSPHLSWLVDRWAAPSWVPWGNVFSVGDVVIGVGGIAFALVATGALDRLRPGRKPEPVAPAA